MAIEISDNLDKGIGNIEGEIKGIDKQKLQEIDFPGAYTALDEVQKNNEKNKEKEKASEKAFEKASEELSKINNFLEKNPLYRTTALEDQINMLTNGIRNKNITNLKTYLENIQYILENPEDITRTFGNSTESYAFTDKEAINRAKNLLGDDVWDYLCTKLTRQNKGMTTDTISKYFSRHVMFNVRDSLGSLKSLKDINMQQNKNRIATLLYKIAGCTGVDKYNQSDIFKNLIEKVYLKDRKLSPIDKAKEVRDIMESVFNIATGDKSGTRGFGADMSKNGLGEEHEIGKDLLNYKDSGKELFKNSRTVYLNDNVKEGTDLKLYLSIRGMDLSDDNQVESYGDVQLQYNENGQEETIILKMSQDGLTLENASELSNKGIKYENNELILPNRLKGKELTLNMTSSQYKDKTYDEVGLVALGDFSTKEPVKQGNGEVLQGHDLGDTELDTLTVNKLNQDVSEYFSLRDYFPSNATKKIELKTGVCGTTMNPEKYEAKKDTRDKKIQQAKDRIGDSQIIAKVFKHLDFGNAFGPEEAPKQEKLARCRLAELFLTNIKLVDIVKENINNLKVVGPDGKEDNFHGESDDNDARTVGFSWSVTENNAALAK